MDKKPLYFFPLCHQELLFITMGKTEVEAAQNGKCDNKVDRYKKYVINIKELKSLITLGNYSRSDN